MKHRFQLIGLASIAALFPVLPIGLSGCVAEPGYFGYHEHERSEGRFRYGDRDDFCAHHPNAEHCEGTRDR